MAIFVLRLLSFPIDPIESDEKLQLSFINRKGISLRGICKLISKREITSILYQEVVEDYENLHISSHVYDIIMRFTDST